MMQASSICTSFSARLEKVATRRERRGHHRPRRLQASARVGAAAARFGVADSRIVLGIGSHLRALCCPPQRTLWMFYCGDTPGRGQRIGLATSSDLRRWSRHPENPVITPRGNWASWSADKPASCRDPHVWRQPDGTFRMLWVADLREPPETSCLALSHSKDLVHWDEVGPVLTRRWNNLESCTIKTESPCLVERHGRYFSSTGTAMERSTPNFRMWPPIGVAGSTFFLGPSHASEIFQADGQLHHQLQPPVDISRTNVDPRACFSLG